MNEDLDLNKNENENENEAEKTESAEKAPKVPFVYDFVSVICTAMFIIMLLFTCIFRFVGVVGPSMQPTLYDGDWLLVTAAKTSYSNGDIIISTEPNAFNEPIVKRVIATGGQSVDIDFSTGNVYVDGVLLKEDYIAESTAIQEDFSGPVTVPEGKLFVMGDNRNHSTDSRSNAIGMIDERYILGKVKVRILPFGSFSLFK